MIDIEFTDPTEKGVRDSWKELLDHYTAWGAKPEAKRKVDDDADLARSNDLLAEMLMRMGKGLGYDFDKVYLKKGFTTRKDSAISRQNSTCCVAAY